MNKLFIFFLAALLAHPAMAANNKIQQQGIKTSAECATAGATDATCLPLSSQVYDPTLGTTVASGISNGTIQQKTLTENAQTGTTYTFVLSDAGKLVSLANSAGATATVPPNSSVAYPVGTVIKLMNKGTGGANVAAGAGVTINSLSGNTYLGGQYAGAQLRKSATNTWELEGTLIPSFIVATGGTITTDGNFKVHTFTSGGNFVVTSGSGTIDKLVIAGGGGGGGGSGTGGGGGGAGGLIYTTGAGPLTAGTYAVTIGAGGTGSGGCGSQVNGGNSTFNGSTAIGGGSSACNSSANTGGSGAGSAFNGTGAAGTAGQGFAGGTGASASNFAGGGGGGAGGVGGGGVGSGTGGAGGVGVSNSITGSSVAYAGGGGGGGTSTGGTGTSGGGNGAGAGVCTNGTNGKGGGGGGDGSNGCAGGSGVVIVRYQYQ